VSNALEALRRAAALYDEMMNHLGGCTDGGCVIKRPTGMHTNGGCKCPSDKVKMQRAMYVANKLRAAVAELDSAAAKGGSDENKS
jgi:hypothetical protein